jgi:hypothetical protein
VLDGVKAAVCANINLFMEMNEEEFAKYLQTFVTDVWHLLVQVGWGGGQLLQQQAGGWAACAACVAVARDACQGNKPMSRVQACLVNPTRVCLAHDSWQHVALMRHSNDCSATWHVCV